MFNLIDYMAILTLLLGGVFLLDFHFIGFLPYIFGTHKLYGDNELEIVSIASGKIVSDCFWEEAEPHEIRGYSSQIDSKLTVTSNNIYIGKKLVSYHYRIAIYDVIEANCSFTKRFRYSIYITAKCKCKNRCFLRIDGYAFSGKERERCSEFALKISALASEKRAN